MTHLSHTGDVFTTITSSSNSSTNKTLSSLNPGTTYDIKVAAKNTQNSTAGPNSDGYSEYTAIHQLTTNAPAAPSYLSITNSSSLENISGLRSPYNSTAYSMDGNTVINNIIRYANAVNLGVTTTTTNNIRTNFTIASTAQNISTFTAFGGLNASYTSNSVSGTVDGFSHAAQNNTYSDPNNIVELVISNDLDYYNGSSTAYQGFYKTVSIKANAKNIATNYTATSDKYTLQLRQEVLSGATVTTNQIDFFIDDLNNSPVLDNVLIDTITVSNTNQYTFISGVLTTGGLGSDVDEPPPPQPPNITSINKRYKFIIKFLI